MDTDQRPKLLIIDDHKELLNAMATFFRRKKCRVITAANGLDGLKRIDAAQGALDLIITDIVMPHIGGVGIISIVRKRYPHIPLIAVTGQGEHPEALALEAEADLVIRKPIQLTTLFEMACSLMDGKMENRGSPFEPVTMDP